MVEDVFFCILRVGLPQSYPWSWSVVVKIRRHGLPEALTESSGVSQVPLLTGTPDSLSPGAGRQLLKSLLGSFSLLSSCFRALLIPVQVGSSLPCAPLFLTASSLHFQLLWQS